jgi:hypothetical protein
MPKLSRASLERRASKLGLEISRKTGWCFGTCSDGVTLGRYALHPISFAPLNGQWHRTLAEIADEIDRREISSHGGSYLLKY